MRFGEKQTFTNYSTNSPISHGMIFLRQAMLAELYIEALPVDGELADQVWVAWDTGPTQRTINSVES